jgi:hypothetical protein
VSKLYIVKCQFISNARSNTQTDDEYLMRCYKDMREIGFDHCECILLEVLPCKNKGQAAERVSWWRTQNPVAPLQCRYEGKAPRKDLYCVHCNDQFFFATQYGFHLINHHKGLAPTNDEFEKEWLNSAQWKSTQERFRRVQDIPGCEPEAKLIAELQAKPV